MTTSDTVPDAPDPRRSIGCAHPVGVRLFNGTPKSSVIPVPSSTSIPINTDQ
jgi:hypothetical protein